MARRLPSLNDLLAFDAAARHASLTRAAQELVVTQPAISRRIAALEADLGARLFDRSSKPMALTPAGTALFDVLRSSLGRLEAVIHDIRVQTERGAITIASPPGFAAFWLIPRLPMLQAAFPEHDLRILTEERDDAILPGDLQIRFGKGPWPDATTLPLFREEVFAVCSPAFLGTRADPLALEEIARSRLLHLRDNSSWLDWRSWFAELGEASFDMPRSVAFDSYANLIAAALAGQGLALCWRGLLDEFLANGALVRVSARSVTSGRGYVVAYREDDAGSSGFVREVAQWLVAQAGAD